MERPMREGAPHKELLLCFAALLSGYLCLVVPLPLLPLSGGAASWCLWKMWLLVRPCG